VRVKLEKLPGGFRKADAIQNVSERQKGHGIREGANEGRHVGGMHRADAPQQPTSARWRWSDEAATYLRNLWAASASLGLGAPLRAPHNAPRREGARRTWWRRNATGALLI
jgi:hypothetical protein